MKGTRASPLVLFPVLVTYVFCNVFPEAGVESPTHAMPFGPPLIPVQRDSLPKADLAGGGNITGNPRFAEYAAKYPRLGTCDGVPAANDDFTIVTALFDLKRENWGNFKRPFRTYLHYSRQLLNMNVPIVAFVEEGLEDFVEYHRQNKGHLTRIISIALPSMGFYKLYYNRIKEVMESDDFKEGHQLLDHPEGFSAKYITMMNAKVWLVYHAMVRDFFRTTYFYWMDMGYGHGAIDLYPKTCNWAPRNIMNKDEKITYIQLNNLAWINGFFDLYKTKRPPFLNGGFFGGSKTAVVKYYFLQQRVFEEFLEEGIVDDDQNMAVACYFENPEVFNIVEGWWYDVFTLFH